ncbi:TonB-dependent receptor plug domain-containing protein [Elizabethkingia anophelis]|uniref:TonB-dependent receptor plug domain-containing protein n=1 Tax=Elizabethkingia anophelis TaxID=1117645 RepID=UPI0009BB324B|nr:TonB-dependent receptor plug domain-containing protein [Elizabethkingia anophelis]
MKSKMRITKLSIGVLFAFISTTSLMAQATQDTIKKNEAKNIEGVKLQGQRNKKTETAILQDQKKAVIQKQAMGAEEISRKGISNVEQGLTKVTGINSVEGRGLFVRGLEERYSYLLINGLGSPSNNPFQKIIALKQFPTDVVGKLNIYKTFNADLYGDFAGATFDIETLTYEKPFTKIEFSVGVNSQNTFRNNFKINPNADTFRGYLGLNSDKRQLPDPINGYQPSGYEFTKQEALNNFKDSWNVDNVKSMPNTGIGFTTAQKFKAGSTGNIGFLLSLNQANSYEYRNGNKNNFNESGDYRNRLMRETYTYGIESSALLGVGYKNKGTKIDLSAMFLQSSDNIIEDFRGYRDQQKQNPLFFRVNQQDVSRFTNIQLIASQKIGDRHTFKAGGSWVNNFFQQPDRKIFAGKEIPGTQDLSMNYGGNNLIRQYFDVNGKNYFSAFAEYNVGLGERNEKNEFPINITAGYNGFADIRNISYRFIYGRLLDPANANVIINRDKPQAQFNEGLMKGAYSYFEGSQQNYKKHLYQFVNAGYINLNYKPNETWDILIGGRVENNMNITRYKDPKSNNYLDTENITKNQYFILPSLAIKKALNNNSNIRFAASKSITRPILIEYMPIEYINPDNENIVGNPLLKNSENYNIDLKYEWFPTNKEMIAFNAFGKIIDNAIERSYISSGNSTGTTITYFNSKRAKIIGLEVEGLIGLNRIIEGLDRWSLGANATFMYTDVERSEEQKNETDFLANRKRKLQGAAPWTVNADLKYEFKNSQNLTNTFSLVYNVSGKKIYGVGFGRLDNVYESPFHQLDFIYNTQLTKNWNLKFAIQNILNQQYKLDLGNRSLIPINETSLRMEDFKRGTNFNLTIGYTF